MNFFDHQQSARRRTAVLVLLFLMATGAIVAATNLVVLGVVWYVNTPAVALLDGAWPGVNPSTVVWTTLATVSVIGMASLYRLATLADGGGAVARALGATLVPASTNDPYRRQLLNVVEEIAIASGVPVPQVYVLEAEGGINALAAGYNAADAAIVVTRGTLEYLTRDELQGVVAHEFSHVLNGDMRLNTRLMALLYGILIVALAGRFILRGAAKARGELGPFVFAVVVGGALAAVGYAGLLCARLIKAAVSRSREYLADAAAVQFTRNPGGIAGALKKLAVSPLRAAIPNPAFEEVSHMLIADRQSWRQSWFASHPPLLDRIRRLEPQFRADELQHIRLRAHAPLLPTSDSADPVQAYAVSASTLADAVGRPDAVALASAAASIAHIPDVLAEAARSPHGAMALVLALVAARRMSGAVDATGVSDDTADARALVPQIQRLDAALHLTLLDLALPALRQRSPEELRRLVRSIDRHLGAEAIRAFDYALSRLVRASVLEVLAPRRAAHALVSPKLYRLRREVQLLLSVVATQGHEGETEAAAAYNRAVRHVQPHDPLPYAVPHAWARPLDLALLRLDRLAPAMKQTLIEALALAISHDGLVMIGELEMLRVVCALLHCPLPALGGGARAAAATPGAALRA